MNCIRKGILAVLCLALLVPAALAEGAPEASEWSEELSFAIEKKRMAEHLSIPGGDAEPEESSRKPAGEGALFGERASEAPSYAEFPAMEWRVENPVVTLDGAEYPLDLGANLRLAPQGEALNAEFAIDLEGNAFFPMRATIEQDSFRFSRESGSRAALVPLAMLEAALGVEDLACLPAYLEALLEYERIYRQADVRNYLIRQMDRELLEALPLERGEGATYELDGRNLAAEVYTGSLGGEALGEWLKIPFETDNPLYRVYFDAQEASSALFGAPGWFEGLLELARDGRLELTVYAGVEEDFQVIEGTVSLDSFDAPAEFPFVLRKRGEDLQIEMTSKLSDSLTLLVTVDDVQESDGERVSARIALYPDEDAASGGGLSSLFHSMELQMDAFFALPDEGGVSPFDLRMAISLRMGDAEYGDLSEDIAVACALSGVEALSNGFWSMDAKMALEFAGMDKRFGLTADVAGSIGGEIEVEGPEGEIVEAQTWEGAIAALGTRTNGLLSMDRAMLLENPKVREMAEAAEAFFSPSWEISDADAQVLTEEIAYTRDCMSIAELEEVLGEPSPLPETLGEFSFQNASILEYASPILLHAVYKNPAGQSLNVTVREGKARTFRLSGDGALVPVENEENLCQLQLAEGDETLSNAASYTGSEWSYSLSGYEPLSREAFAVLLQDLIAHCP